MLAPNPDQYLVTPAGRSSRRALGGRSFIAALRAAFIFGFMVCLCLLPGCKGGGCVGSWGGPDRDGLLPGGMAEPEPLPDIALSKTDVLTQRDKARAKLDSAANAIGWIAGLCAIAALGTMILSFIVPFIPTKTSIGCFAAAVAGYVLQYALLVYGVMFSEIAIWLGVVVLGAMGLSVGLPWTMGVSNWIQTRTGKRLIAEAKVEDKPENIAAGVALIANAQALTSPQRKALLVQAKRNPTRVEIRAAKRAAKLASKRNLLHPNP